MVRVYILSDDDLFGQGVMSLLRLESEIEIVGQGKQVDQVIKDIRRLTPDAVIVESGDVTGDSISIVARILSSETSIKVIGLNLGENKLHLYHGELREARGIEDLVDAIKTELTPSLRGA